MRQPERPPSRVQGGEPTIADVAGVAGTSIRTVSRVLNGSPKVSAETRARVDAAIGALDFRRSPRARALALGRSLLIGMVHNDRNALVLDAVQRGIAAEAAADGFELVAHNIAAGQAGAAEDVVRFVRRSRVDGLVVLPPVSGLADLPGKLAAEGIAAVALSACAIAGFAGLVVSDERGAAAAIARHFLALGHRRIAMVNGPLDALSARERREGFLGALAGAGVALLQEAPGDYGFQSGLDAAQRLLSGEGRPTAVFAANDIMAAAVLKVAAARGISVPGRLSVAGFDGTILAEMLSPALTTIARPFADMAGRATRLLLNELAGLPRAAPERLELVLRPAESTGPAPAD